MNALIFLVKAVSMIGAAMLSFVMLASLFGGDSLASGIQLCTSPTGNCLFSIF